MFGFKSYKQRGDFFIFNNQKDADKYREEDSATYMEENGSSIDYKWEYLEMSPTEGKQVVFLKKSDNTYAYALPKEYLINTMSKFPLDSELINDGKNTYMLIKSSDMCDKISRSEILKLMKYINEDTDVAELRSNPKSIILPVNLLNSGKVSNLSELQLMFYKQLLGSLGKTAIINDHLPSPFIYSDMAIEKAVQRFYDLQHGMWSYEIENGEELVYMPESCMLFCAPELGNTNKEYMFENLMVDINLAACASGNCNYKIIDITHNLYMVLPQNADLVFTLSNKVLASLNKKVFGELLVRKINDTHWEAKVTKEFLKVISPEALYYFIDELMVKEAVEYKIFNTEWVKYNGEQIDYEVTGGEDDTNKTHHFVSDNNI